MLRRKRFVLKLNWRLRCFNNILYQLQGCYYFVYRHCVRYSILVDHGCMRLNFDDLRGFAFLWLYPVIAAFRSSNRCFIIVGRGLFFSNRPFFGYEI